LKKKENVIKKEASPAKSISPGKNASPAKSVSPAKSASQSPNKSPSKSPSKSPNKLPKQQSTPKKSSPIKNENDNKTSPFKTPEKTTPKKFTRTISPIVDESPMQKTKNLVNKWEDIKRDNEKLAKATKYENEKSDKRKSTPAPSRNSTTTFTPISNFLSSETNKKGVTLDETKLKDHIPEITKKFSMKDKRIRENIKRFNQSYHTANIDLKNNDKKIVVVKPIIKEKRVYVEEDDDSDKVQRSKRVKLSELDNDGSTSIWHKINSAIHSLKETIKSKTEEKSVDSSAGRENESFIIAPTVKHQEVKEPVRLDESTCLDIFNPSTNKSIIPMYLRLRRNGSLSKEDNSIPNNFVKSNTKPEWVNKLYMVISNETSSPKLFDIPVHWTSLSSQMVYILNISDEALIQFNGSESLNRDKDYAQRICKRISLNDNVPDIFEIEQEESYNNDTVALQLFWKALELENYTDEERKKFISKNDTQNLKDVLIDNKKEIDIENAIYVYRINEQTKSLDLIHNGTFPTYRCLNSNTSMIFDFVGEVYLWQGKNSSLNARSIGIKFAQKIFNDYKRPSWASLRKINEGHEQILFQEKFKDSFYFL
jgi:hypothetical protein